MNTTLLCACLTGASHKRLDIPCQDSVGFIQLNGLYILAAADGLGSAVCSDIGSSLAVDTALTVLARDPHASFNDVYNQCHLKLAAIANEEGERVTQYATTLSLAVFTPQRVRLAQLGDGAVVFSWDEQHFQLMPAPKNQTELANVTANLTQSDYSLFIDEYISTEPLKFVAMFSDGLHASTLDKLQGQAHQPFFRYLAKNLKSHPEPERYLHQLLACKQVTSRSDDDKSMVCWQQLSSKSKQQRVNPGGET